MEMLLYLSYLGLVSRGFCCYCGLERRERERKEKEEAKQNLLCVHYYYHHGRIGRW